MTPPADSSYFKRKACTESASLKASHRRVRQSGGWHEGAWLSWTTAQIAFLSAEQETAQRQQLYWASRALAQLSDFSIFFPPHEQL